MGIGRGVGTVFLRFFLFATIPCLAGGWHDGCLWPVLRMCARMGLGSEMMIHVKFQRF
jgi:hypothetical protein